MHLKKIFIPDFLPLNNKGEEAILRGIETIYKEDNNDSIEFSIFDNVNKVEKKGNINIFPVQKIYPSFITGRSKGKINRLITLICAALYRINIFPYVRNLKKNENLWDKILSSDIVLIGHDGFFNIFCAGIGNLLHRNSVKYAILGAGFYPPPKKYSFLLDKIYKTCFDNAKYVVLRENTAYEYVKQTSNNTNVFLFPDPAFFNITKQEIKEQSNDILKQYGFDNNNLNIGVTLCENSISFTGSFISSTSKSDSHRELLLSLFSKLTSQYNCHFYILPHCIENGKGNDVLLSKSIFKNWEHGNITIIDMDLSVNVLKNIINKMDFIIGERTHSIINSIAERTPFTMLTCSSDFRSHDIIEKGCNLAKLVIDLDNPDIDLVFNSIKSNIDAREKIHSSLIKIQENHLKSLYELRKILQCY